MDGYKRKYYFELLILFRCRYLLFFLSIRYCTSCGLKPLCNANRLNLYQRSGTSKINLITLNFFTTNLSGAMILKFGFEWYFLSSNELSDYDSSVLWSAHRRTESWLICCFLLFHICSRYDNFFHLNIERSLAEICDCCSLHNHLQSNLAFNYCCSWAFHSLYHKHK